MVGRFLRPTTIDNIKCNQSTAENGGCIRASGSIIITNSIISKNLAKENGGAAMVTSDKVDINASQFLYNATGYGGALMYMYKFISTVTDTGIQRNIHFHSADITKTTFNRNIASHAGGTFLTATNTRQAVNFTTNELRDNNFNTSSLKQLHVLSVTKCAMNGSRAKFGGVLYGASERAIFDACNITSNAVTSGGGVCYCRYGTCSFKDSIVKNNFAYYKGGVIMQETPNLFYTLSNTIFVNNSASIGGVINTESGVRITSCELYHNTADEAV